MLEGPLAPGCQTHEALVGRHHLADDGRVDSGLTQESEHAVCVLRSHGGQERALGDRGERVDADEPADRRGLGADRHGLLVEAHTHPRGLGDLDDSPKDTALGGVVEARDAGVPHPVGAGDARVYHHGHLLEEAPGVGSKLGPDAGGQRFGEGGSKQRRRLDRRALSAEEQVAGAGHVGGDVAVGCPHRQHGGAAHHGVGAALVAGRVARDDGDAKLPAGLVDAVPKLGELALGDRQRQVEVDREVGGGQARHGGIGSQDMHGKPGGATKAVLGDDEDRVAGRRQHRASGQLDDRDVDARLRADEDIVAGVAQPGVDQGLEDGGRDLADGRQLRHVLTSEAKAATGVAAAFGGLALGAFLRWYDPDQVRGLAERPLSLLRGTPSVCGWFPSISPRRPGRRTPETRGREMTFWAYGTSP